ncbi:MAG: hypothetical protein ACKO96_08145, partial [Flammeovirgaceae bacterium]
MLMEQAEATIMHKPVVADDGDSEVEDADIEEGHVDLPPQDSSGSGAPSPFDIPGGYLQLSTPSHGLLLFYHITRSYTSTRTSTLRL